MNQIARIVLFVMLGMIPTLVDAQVLGDPVDVSHDFQRMENVYFIGSRVSAFDAATGQGNLQWDRYRTVYQTRRRVADTFTCSTCA